MALGSRSTLARNGFGRVIGRFQHPARRRFALSCVRAQDENEETPTGWGLKLPPNPNNNNRDQASWGPPSPEAKPRRQRNPAPDDFWNRLEDVSPGDQQAVSSVKHFFNPELRQRMVDAGFETSVQTRDVKSPERVPSEVAGTFTPTTKRRRRPKEKSPSEVVEVYTPPPIRTHHSTPPSPFEDGETDTASRKNAVAKSVPNQMGTFLNGQPEYFSPILLRDLCTCPSCLDSSTKQKLFSTADIPLNIKTRAVAQDSSSISLLWDNDIPGYDEDHATVLDFDVLRGIRDAGASPSADIGVQPGKQTIWDAQQYRQLNDIDYEEYMQDDATLFRALQQLHTYGMLFVRNVPDDAKAVSTIGERIGPIKNTFYGYTWDVRSVPEAKNVAYTSQDLGFHMDLLYMHQPPHLQLLHCIRSSAAGGASLFTDSYKAAADLFTEDIEAFITLATTPASFHYNHAESGHLYHQDQNVIQIAGVSFGFPNFKAFAKASHQVLNDEYRSRNSFQANSAKTVRSFIARERKIEDYFQNVAWSPPFQAPIRLVRWRNEFGDGTALPILNDRVTQWHSAAQKFSKLIHRQSGIYERMMRPGECVIFDNRRVLHARKAFEVGDAGKERWLRGTYLDWDPYWSKMRVLGRQFGKMDRSRGL